MNDLRYGGLHGKARRAHSRNRASSLHAQRLIAEFDGDDTEVLFAQRDIPLGRRNDFLPSVVFSTAVDQDNQEWHGIGTQLQLPLTVLDGSGGLERDGEIGRVSAGTEDENHGRGVIRILRSERASMFKQPEQMQDSQQVTLGGFLKGCAMGTAAAVLLLLVLRVTFI